MVPKIVTRLANIAAKMAGSDKYDPTVEPVTAFEYYLDKAADKVLAIRGLPSRPSTDKNLVLVSTPNGEIWEEPSVAKSFTLRCAYPETAPLHRLMTDEEIQIFTEIFNCLSNDVPFTLFYNAIVDDVAVPFKQQMIVDEFDRVRKAIGANLSLIEPQLGSDWQLTYLHFKLVESEDKQGNIMYEIVTYKQEFNLTEIQGG